MPPSRAAASVVFDVHVFVNALIGADSTYPFIGPVPPSTDNAAADCLSIAFDSDEFRLHVSPHIVTNTVRVLKSAGVSARLVERYIDAVLDIVAESGGQVIDPPRTVFDVSDYEDNLELDLVAAVDALMLVSDDTDLTSMNPWNGRLILRPRDFVARVVQSRRGPRGG
jgi:predicted nucleic acid-binding protein